jgi:hypothetical protein
LSQHETAIIDLRTASEVYRLTHGKMGKPAGGIEELNVIDELIESVR